MRIQKVLYFKYGKKWGKDHRCKASQVFAIARLNNVEDGEDNIDVESSDGENQGWSSMVRVRKRQSYL